MTISDLTKPRPVTGVMLQIIDRGISSAPERFSVEKAREFFVTTTAAWRKSKKGRRTYCHQPTATTFYYYSDGKVAMTVFADPILAGLEK